MHKQVGIAKHGCMVPCLKWNKMITYRRDGYGTILKTWRSLYSAGLRGSYESATDLALAQALIFWNSMSSSQYCRVQHGLEVTSYAMLPGLLRSSFNYRLSANLQAKIRYPLRIRSFFLVELISLPPFLVFEGFHFGKRSPFYLYPMSLLSTSIPLRQVVTSCLSP